MTSTILVASSAAAFRSNRRDPLPWLFALVFAVAIPVAGGGGVLAADVLMAIMLWPALLSLLNREIFLRRLWLVALLWSAAQVVSDLVHKQYHFSSLMYVAPVTALLATGLLWLHSQRAISVSALLVAVGAGWMILEIISGNILSSSNPWKYGLSTPVTILVLSIAYNRKMSRATIVGLLLALAVTSYLFDSRIQLALFLVCAISLCFVHDSRSKQERRTTRTIGSLLIVGFSLYSAYPAAASSGILGVRASQQQAVYDKEGANYVLATRKEFPQIAYLVSQNPVLGIGSYGALSREQRSGALEFVDSHVAPLTATDRSYLTSSASTNVGYRAHSSAMSSALYAGIFALPFWVFLLVQNGRAALRFAQGRGTVPVLLLYMCALTTWDAFFSPITNRTHLSVGITLFLLAVVMKREKNADTTGRAVTP
ncbi:hypothetical protein [Rhodococcus jostii]|uniref:O-antigen ligase n=1 Tax=Rhodococcus jostii TaxID=132919 RepID=A0A1H5HKQ2_RHOJO|nr:hypothetical protein [Rhodococcus jostii]SEE28334.1 hypothetical protein SAMN04490220_7241 [Rhodococcus jostii]